MAKSKTPAAAAAIAATAPKSKLQHLIDLLERPEGAAIGDMMSATGWQAHSVRGALAGALRRKGHRISSDIIDGRRVYRLAAEGADA